MNGRRTQLLGVAAFAITSVHAAVLDRIAVTVGRRVITESAVVRDVRVAAFLDKKPVVLTGATKRAAADRLVDQLLILDEAAFSHLTLPSEADSAAMLSDVKRSYPGPQPYQDGLKAYGITEQDVAQHLLAGLRTLRFTDLRFRPEVQISEDDLHDYYSFLVKQWRGKNQENIPTFEAARSDVEQMVTNERVMQALDRWLGTARTSTEIVYREEAFQ